MTPVTHAAEIGKWYHSIKSALDLSSPGMMALIGGGTGALLTGGAAAASGERLGETPAERRMRVIKEALTGGGVGAIAGAAVPTGAKLLRDMLPPATEAGKRISELKNTFAAGTPTDNLLSKQAPGLLYLGGVTHRAVTGQDARSSAIMQHARDFVARGTAAEDAFQRGGVDYARNAAKGVALPPMPAPGNAGATTRFNQTMAQHNAMVENLRNTFLDTEALKPTGMRGTLSEAIQNFGKLKVPQLPSPAGGGPVRPHNIKNFSQLGSAPEPVQRVGLEELRKLIAKGDTGTLAKAFTGHKVPGGVRLPSRLSYLNPGRGMGLASIASMLLPAVLRGGAGLAEQGAPYVGK